MTDVWRCKAGDGWTGTLAGAAIHERSRHEGAQTCWPSDEEAYPAECEHEAAGGWSEFCTACLNRQRELSDPGLGDPGSLRIVHERCRQIEVEGYTIADDVARQPDGELAVAAWCYLGDLLGREFDAGHMHPPAQWPWDHRHWKPTNSIQQLAKAGALIAAEIDRRLVEQERQHDPERFNDEGLTPGGWAKSPI